MNSCSYVRNALIFPTEACSWHSFAYGYRSGRAELKSWKNRTSEIQKTRWGRHGTQAFEVIFFSMIFGAFIIFFPVKGSSEGFYGERLGQEGRFFGEPGEQLGSPNSLTVRDGNRDWNHFFYWSQQIRTESE